MDKGQARDYCRFLLDDTIGTIILNKDIDFLLNMGIDNVISEIRGLQEDYFVKEGLITTEDDVRKYPYSEIDDDVFKIRKIERNISPEFAHVQRIDWIKHKAEFASRGIPTFFYEINQNVYFVKVPDGAYEYVVFYEQLVTYPIDDKDPIPLIPETYHPMVALEAAIMAKQHLNDYKKEVDDSSLILTMLQRQQARLHFELTGKRIDDKEESQGALGSEVKKASAAGGGY